MWMGVDYGQARLGLALYDETLPLVGARPLTTLPCRGRRDAVCKVAEWAGRHAVTRIVVGIPLAPDGGVGLSGAQARNFAADLGKALEIPVFLQDERDSTLEALQRLIAGGASMRQRADRIDEVAAAVILDRFVESEREGGGARALPPREG